jgi:hypothetical protein
MQKIYGSGLEPNTIFKDIISVGFELETHNISKFTLLSGYDNVLLNTDTTGEDAKEIIRIQNGEISDDEYEYENVHEELIELVPYTTKSIGSKTPTEYPNTSFHITNDMATTPLSKYLKKICDIRTDEEKEETDDENKFEYMNKLYKFHGDDGETFNLHFEKSVPSHCGIFTGVEWIATYYNPEKSRHTIVDAFVNCAKNLIHHLDSLQPVSGKITISYPDTDYSATIKNPECRLLYRLPGTNLHYLQTHFFNRELTIDDICLTPQMTFACHSKNVINICKQLTPNNKSHLENAVYQGNMSYETLIRIEKCVDELIREYNKRNTNAQFVKRQNDEIFATVRSCFFMVLYKLSTYYTKYVVAKKENENKEKKYYFKDSLFINSRHSNYMFYAVVKTKLKTYFRGRTDFEIADIIQKMVLQPSILNMYVLNGDTTLARKHVFSFENKLEISNRNYGNPIYSLKSYFDYFEKPPVVDGESPNGGEDWFEENNVDVHSTRMPIENDIFLIEHRGFRKVLNTIIYNIGDPELMRDMTHGICNEMTNNYTSDNAGISILVLRKFISVYEKKRNRSTTRKQSVSARNPSKTRKQSTVARNR